MSPVFLSSVPSSFRPTLLRLCCSPIWTMQLLHGFGLAVLLQPTAYGLAPSFAWPRSITGAPSRGSHRSPLGADRRLAGELEKEGGAAGVGRQTKTSLCDHSDKVTLYEEFSKYADRTAVAQDVIFEITSKEHFDDVVSRAAGADEASLDGYEDSQGNLRIPHKLLMVEIHAGWCRVCKGLQPKLLKLVSRHPEVLCCKINKTSNEELAGKLGVRGLPMIIFYKNGKRVDHFTTANINTIEEGIRDNS